MLGPRGDCLGLGYPNSDWVHWTCQHACPGCLSSRIFAFQQRNKARPDKSTTTGLHHAIAHGMDASHAPYRRAAHAHATPRYAMLSCAIPCHAIPFISVHSISQSPGLSGLRSDIDRWATSLRWNPRYQATEWGTLGLVVASVAVSSISPVRFPC